MKPALHSLDALLADRPGPCVTFHLPLAPGEADGRQVRIRWKNLLRRAAAELTVQGLAPASAEALLEPAHAFDPHGVLPGHRAEGLVVFLAPGFFRTELLYAPPREDVSAGPCFRLGPLIHAMAGRDRLHVLALSQRHVRLIEATAAGAAEVEIGGLPRTIEKALEFDEHEAVLRLHATGPVGAPQHAPVFHGQGGRADAHHDDLLRFCRRVHDAVRPVVENGHVPLVLAAVEELRAAYETASGNPGLAFLPGNPDRLRPEELADRARELVESRASRLAWQAAERFHALAGTGRTCGSVPEVAAAAEAGRIETLFLAEDGEGRELDEAAVQALRHGGSVHVLPRARVPSRDTSAAAILRY